MSRIRTKVSIGIPVYNGEQYLPLAFDSILAQTYGDFEVIVSDNASSDGTEDICREFAARDFRIHYHRQKENQGAPWNFNRVFRLSDTDYFRWHCVDDLVRPGMLASCVEVLDRYEDVVLCYPRVLLIDETGRDLGEYHNGLDLSHERAFDRYFTLFRNLQLCNIQYGLMRSKVLRKTLLMRDFLGSDEVFLGELSLYGKFREIPENALLIRMHPKASSSLRTKEELQAFYNPTREPKTNLRLLRHMKEKIRTVGRSPIPLSQKILIFGGITREAVSNRDAIGHELVDAVRGALGLPEKPRPVQNNDYNPYMRDGG
jgi:glycosyltransferase involved in cell wall biosynthesis